MKISFYRHQKSTPYVLTHLGRKAYFKTREAAEKVLETLDHILCQDGYDTDDAEQWRRARKILGGIEPIDAARFYADRHPSTDSMPLLSKAVENYLMDQMESGRRPKYLTELSRSLRSCLGNRHDKRPADVTTDQIKEHLNGLCSPHSRHDRIKHLRAFFGWCWKHRYVSENPCAGIQIPAPRRHGEITFLKVHEARALLEAALKHDASMVPFFSMQLFCGIRTEEMLHLDWSSVDLVNGIHLRRTKCGIPRVITWLPECLRPWIEARVRKGGQVVPRGFRKRRDHVIARATHAPDGTELFSVPQNCLRHTYATYACAYHESWQLVMEQMGHRNPRMLYEHYRNYVSKAAAVEFFSIKPPEGLKS
jgi:integrase